MKDSIFVSRAICATLGYLVVVTTAQDTTARPTTTPCDHPVRPVLSTSGLRPVVVDTVGVWLRPCPGIQGCYNLSRCDGSWTAAQIPTGTYVGNYFGDRRCRVLRDDCQVDPATGTTPCLRLPSCLSSTAAPVAVTAAPVTAAPITIVTAPPITLNTAAPIGLNTRAPTTSPTRPCVNALRPWWNVEGHTPVQTDGIGFWLKPCSIFNGCYTVERCNGTWTRDEMPTGTYVNNWFGDRLCRRLIPGCRDPRPDPTSVNDLPRCLDWRSCTPLTRSPTTASPTRPTRAPTARPTMATRPPTASPTRIGNSPTSRPTQRPTGIMTLPPFSLTSPPISITRPPFSLTSPPISVTRPPFSLTFPPFTVVTLPPFGTRPPVATRPPTITRAPVSVSAPTTMAPTTVPPTTALPCRRPVLPFWNDVGQHVVPTDGPGWTLRRCPNFRRCFNLTRCNPQGAVNSDGTPAPYQIAAADSFFGDTQCRIFRDGCDVRQQTAAGARRCLSTRSCLGSLPPTTAPTTATDTTPAPVSRAPTPAPTRPTPCQAAARPQWAHTGLLLVETLDIGFWLRPCPYREGCYESVRCNGSALPSELPPDAFQGNWFGDRVCRRVSSLPCRSIAGGTGVGTNPSSLAGVVTTTTTTPAPGTSVDNVLRAAALPRCFRRLPCDPNEPTAAPTVAVTRAPVTRPPITAAPTARDTTITTTQAPSTQTSAPTAVPCTNAIRPIPTNAGVSFVPTQRYGFVFRRCANRPNCFLRIPCRGDADGTATSVDDPGTTLHDDAFGDSVCRTIRTGCDPTFNSAPGMSQCYTLYPCQSTPPPTTASPTRQTRAPVTAAPTRRPTRDIIIDVSVTPRRAGQPQPGNTPPPRETVELVFDIDFDDIDPTAFGAAVIDALVASGTARDRILSVLIHPGSVIAEVTTDSSETADAARAAAAAGNITVDHNGSPVAASATSPSTGEGNASSGGSDSASGSTAMIAGVVAAVAVVALVVLVVARRQRRQHHNDKNDNNNNNTHHAKHHDNDRAGTTTSSSSSDVNTRGKDSIFVPMTTHAYVPNEAATTTSTLSSPSGSDGYLVTSDPMYDMAVPPMQGPAPTGTALSEVVVGSDYRNGGQYESPTADAPTSDAPMYEVPQQRDDHATNPTPYNAVYSEAV
eukprot:m.141634 g.141634  ORF g.141634 m.141634 type:complete len:1147 (+) comp11562_c0_seq2:281-3721(+)